MSTESNPYALALQTTQDAYRMSVSYQPVTGVVSDTEQVRQAMKQELDELTACRYDYLRTREVLLSNCVKQHNARLAIARLSSGCTT